MSHSRRRRHEEHEEHENHERWLVTYADMVTLLMVLFIVMFAMSQVDEEKFAALKEGLSDGFGFNAVIEPGSDGILKETGVSAMTPVQAEAGNQLPQTLTEAEKKQVMAIIQGASAKEAELREKAKAAAANAELERLVEMEKKVMVALSAKGLAGDVVTTIDHRGLTISLVSQNVVFRADIAQLSDRGKELVDTIGPVLAKAPDPIEIDGHTNQVPVAPAYYATDWDLAAARAITVLTRLSNISDIPNKRMKASSYGNTKPLVNPALPNAAKLNKRVDIIVLTSLGSEVAALLDKNPAASAASSETSSYE